MAQELAVATAHETSTFKARFSCDFRWCSATVNLSYVSYSFSLIHSMHMCHS